MMYHQFKFSPILFVVALILFLSACGAPARTEDAAPLQEEVLPGPETPVEAATAEPEEAADTVPEAETSAEAATAEPEVAADTIPEAETPAEASPEPESPTKPEPEGAPEAVITFDISGGFVEFCDTLMVTASGAYTLRSCQAEELAGALEPDDLEILQAWSEQLAGFDLKIEDNPGEPDNLVSELIFNGAGSEAADEVQQQLIFDWVNGLLIRVRPQPVAAPATVEPPEIGPDGLCPEVNRPAILIADYENPSNLILVDPETQTRCDILLPQPPFGRIMTDAGNIYYPVFDPEAETVTIWQLSSDGEQLPLTFTGVPAEQFGPINFVLSDDGAKIAWGRAVTNFEADPPIYHNDLWVANIDGSEMVSLLEQVENSESRYVEPVRFSRDKGTLYYALQPDGLGGSIFSFSARFDNLYEVSTGGGQGQLLFDCATELAETPFCIGDISPDGNYLAYTQPDQGLVKVLGHDGSVVADLTPPTTDYIGPALFGPGGDLVFISATLVEAETDEPGLPQPSPGYLSLLRPPYTGQAETLLTDDRVATLWEWLDENRVAFGSIDEAGNIGTSLVTLEGQVTQLSPNFALAVLR
jgi:hypothetical protein